MGLAIRCCGQSVSSGSRGSPNPRARTDRRRVQRRQQTIPAVPRASMPPKHRTPSSAGSRGGTSSSFSPTVRCQPQRCFDPFVSHAPPPVVDQPSRGVCVVLSLVLMLAGRNADWCLRSDGTVVTNFPPSGPPTARSAAEVARFRGEVRKNSNFWLVFHQSNCFELHARVGNTPPRNVLPSPALLRLKMGQS